MYNNIITTRKSDSIQKIYHCKTNRFFTKNLEEGMKKLLRYMVYIFFIKSVQTIINNQ